MPTTVHVRPLDSKGITQSSGNQPLADNGGTAEKHPSWFPRLLIFLCIVQMIMVIAIAVVLAIFLNAHGKDIGSLKIKTGILEVDMGNIQTNNWQVPGNVSNYIDVESRLLQVESNQSNNQFELQLLNGRITTLESNVDTYPTAAFIAQIDDNLMYINATMEAQADTILTLNNTIGQLHSVIYIQNISILDNKEKLDQLDSGVTDAQNSIKTQVTVIQQLADNHIAANVSVHDLSSRIDALESGIAIDRAMVSDLNNIIGHLKKNLNYQNTSIHIVNEKLLQLNFSSEQDRPNVTELSNIIELLAKNLKDQNTSIQAVNEKLLQLNFSREQDRSFVTELSNIIELLEKSLNDQNTSIQAVNEKLLQQNFSSEQDLSFVTELNTRVGRLEKNVTNEAIFLQNIASRLNEIDLNMTIVNQMIQTEHDNIEQLTVNLTANRIDTFAFITRLSDFEANVNSSETSIADHASRIGQLEAMQLSGILLNEEQKTQLIELGEELNNTWNAVQNLSNGTPVNGNWTEWTVWSSCSSTCGDGQMTRGRYCVNPMPANGGLDCDGPQMEQQTCKIRNCPVNGGWSTWSGWSSCSRTCGPGLSQRQRTCTNPTPSSLGQACIGDATNIQLCEMTACPVATSAFSVSDPVEGTSNDKIRFTREFVNTDGHYSVSTGVFTCPYSGLYVFVLHLMKMSDVNQAYCWVQKNSFGKIAIQSTVSGNSLDSYFVSSNSVILHLDVGDAIDIGGCTSIDTIYDATETSFTGFLLKAD